MNNCDTFKGLTVVKSLNGYVVHAGVIYNPAQCWSFENIESMLNFVRSEIDK